MPYKELKGYVRFTGYSPYDFTGNKSSDADEDYIIPAPFDPRVKDAVAGAVKQAARDSGVARL